MKGLLLAVSGICGVLYYVGCLMGFATESSGWLVAALLIPPLDIAYPLFALGFGNPFPVVLVALGATAIVSLIAAGTLEEQASPY